MAIKIGDRLPEATLSEYVEMETPGCSLGPNDVAIPQAARGKRVVLFGLPGAFTPTCSSRHVPGYLEVFDQLRAKGVDEVWCVSVNDAYVMGAWARDQKTAGKVRMLADGSAVLTRALGLEVDFSSRGMGLRSQRYSMLVEDGVVKALHVEQPGKFEVSDAGTMLHELR
jgi:peroxiredoxin